MATKQTKRPAPKQRGGQFHKPAEKKPRPAPLQPKPTAAVDPAAEENLWQLRAVIGDPQPTVAVVGGGAAGLAAAITAAQAAPGLRVVLLEKAPRVGRKLLATGNGRCNLTNQSLSAADYVSADSAALAQFLSGHSSADTQAWFASLGLLCTAEEGRVYPHCQQASAVLDVLRAAARAAGVITVCGCLVTGVTAEPCRLALQLGDVRESLAADKIILAVGGAAAPALGGSSQGCGLAQSLGHSCTALAPGLAALRCSLAAPAGQGEKPADLLPGLKGVRALASVTLWDGTAPLATEAGEVQFGEGTLSGIPVLQLSLLLPGLSAGRLTVDLLPQLSAQQLTALLQARCATPGLTLEDLLLGTVHKKLGHAVLKAAGLAPLSRLATDVSGQQLTALTTAVKALPLAVHGTQGWDGAQTTVGGVPLAQVDPATCASRVVPGLYLAGEVLDAAGRCGGYNLDWAFTTGRRAGKAAALSLAYPR